MSEDQLIEERDQAEEAFSQAYFSVIGNAPEFSNHFGYTEALVEIEETVDSDRASINELNQRLIDRTEAGLAKTAELQRELQQANEQIKKLQSWKDQQMQVESEWNPQELAKMLGGTIGTSCRKIIQEKVPEMVAQNGALRNALEKFIKAAKDGEVELFKGGLDALTAARQALSSPPPPVVPLAQYDELKTDAEALVGLLYLACFGSCTCETKTPEILHHSNSCSFRVYSEAIATFRAKHPKREGA